MQERLAHLLADSLDVLESEDTLELLVAVCRSDLNPLKILNCGFVYGKLGSFSNNKPLFIGKGWLTFWTGWLTTTLSLPCRSTTTSKPQTQQSQIPTLDLSLLLQLPCHWPGFHLTPIVKLSLDSVINVFTRLLPILTAVLEEEDGEPWLNHLQVIIGALSTQSIHILIQNIWVGKISHSGFMKETNSGFIKETNSGLFKKVFSFRRVPLFSARQQMCMRRSPSRRLPQTREILGPAPYTKLSHHFGRQPCPQIQPDLVLFLSLANMINLYLRLWYSSTCHTVPPKINMYTNIC